MKYYVVSVNDEGTYDIVGELIQCKDCKHSVDYYNDGQCYCRNKNYNGDSLIYISGGWNHHCGYAERKKE